MTAGQFGFMVGAFLMSLLTGIVTVMIGRAIKARLIARYVVACGLAVVLAGLPDGNNLALVGGLLAVGVLYWRFTMETAAIEKAAVTKEASR
jgi:hypothetical protein